MLDTSIHGQLPVADFRSVRGVADQESAHERISHGAAGIRRVGLGRDSGPVAEVRVVAVEVSRPLGGG